MPQLLKNVLSADRIGSIVQGPGCLTKFPEFCAAVAETIGFGSHVDYEMARIFASLLGVNSKIGTALYFGQQSADARRRLLTIAAPVQLSEALESKEVFDLVWKAVNSVRRTRNAFAHGIWGHTPSIDDAVLLIDVDEMAQLDMGHLADTPRDVFASEYTYVYRKADFASAADNARQAYNAAHILRAFLGEANSSRRDAMRQSLHQMPLIKGLMLPNPQ